MAEKDTGAIRKRAQIAKANRIMFIWVAAASVVVSASVVLLIVVAQKGVHNQKAINKLNTTVATLKRNNGNVEGLGNSIRALGSNESLLALRTNDTDNALQVVLDALPADLNPSAFGASLQTRLIPAEVQVESIQIDSGAADGSDEAVQDAAATVTDGVSTIPFRLIVTGEPAQLKVLLERLERSIRTIQVTSLTIEGGDAKQSLTINGIAYYQLAQQLRLVNEDVKP